MSEPIQRDIIRLEPGRITAKQIIRDVADKHGATVEELLSPVRRKLINVVRQEAMWLIHRHTKLSNGQIAERLGRSHPSTVWHGIRAHARRIGDGG